MSESLTVLPSFQGSCEGRQIIIFGIDLVKCCYSNAKDCDIFAGDIFIGHMQTLESLNHITFEDL